MKFKKLAGPLFTFLVAIVPVVLWLLFSPIASRLSDRTEIIDAIAKISALSGLALLSFNIILSARLAIFERLFLGLDRAYRAHRLIGGSTLMLLMLHGAMITAKYSSISLLSGFEYLKPSFDIPLMLGKMALVIMIITVVISVYIRIKYQWFIIVQRVLGAMIFLGGYHALFVSGSDLRSIPMLFGYFILLGGSAVFLYVYRSVFHKSIKRTFEYRILSVSHSKKVSLIWLKPVASAMAFYAGQFAFFKFDSKAVDTESHPFSFSSSSDDENIRIAVKSAGDYTTDLRGVRVGDSVQIEGPYGYFSFTKIRASRQVWVAGGIGITPFLSMAHSLPKNYQVILYYCVNTISDAIFLKELENLATENKNLELVLVCNDHNQKIRAKDFVSSSTEAYLLCAPSAMMFALEKQLRDLGVPNNSVYYEDFALR